MAVYTTIDDAGVYFNPKIYTGTGSSLAVTGVGFSADFTWLKERDGTNDHNAFDTVRGAGELIRPNANNAESTTTEGLKSWQSDGFTLGTNTSLNGSGQTFVAWNWKAGTTTGIDATGATITPSAYSFNQTAGFSVITYTGNGVAGATVPHGLGVVPEFIIVKCTSTTASWMIFQGSSIMGATKFMYLDESQAAQAETERWNDTAPTSVLFSLGTASSGNTNTATYVAYCFAEIQGYSKISYYTQNGNVDGPFCYTGFRPSFVLAKVTNASDNWAILDNKRIGFNNSNYRLRANKAEAAYTGSPSYIDILSNGFKIRSNDAEINSTTGGATYMYVAWAEAPFVNSNGVPCNAR